MERNGTNGTVYVNDTVNVNENEFVSETEYEDDERTNECASHDQKINQEQPFVFNQGSNTEGKGQTPTPQQVFEFYKVFKLTIPPDRFFNYQVKHGWRDSHGKIISNWAGAYCAMNEVNPGEWETHNPDYKFNKDDYLDSEVRENEIAYKNQN
ncbi:MAG: hypothetical protein NC489_29135 [Ruminococcus flavefaciens]|nr:hypothetical protein [Ruminococcus flavefaciens]